MLLLGLFAQIAKPALAIVSAKCHQIDSLENFLGFEVAYMAMFGWFSIAGPGQVSLDYLLQRWIGSKGANKGVNESVTSSDAASTPSGSPPAARHSAA